MKTMCYLLEILRLLGTFGAGEEASDADPARLPRHLEVRTSEDAGNAQCSATSPEAPSRAFLSNLPPELKLEIVLCASTYERQVRAAFLKALRLLDRDFHALATAEYFKAWGVQPKPFLYQEFHDLIAPRYGSLVQQITILIRRDRDLRANPLTHDDALRLRLVPGFLPHLPNLTIFKVDGLPAALGDFVYEPILQVLARTPLPNLRDLTLASYTGRPMDPRQLAVTLCKFPTVTRLTMCLVAWCAEPDLCDALAALPLSMLSAQGVDGPVFQHLAAALQGRDTSITFLWLRGCPMVTLTELHTFTTILQHSLNTLIFEPSTTSTLPMTPFSLPHLRELIFRVHTPWAFDFLHLFHFCPIRRLVLGSFQTEHWASGLAEAGVVRELQGLFKARAAGWSGSGTGGARESMELILEVPGWEGGAELTEREEGLSRLLERWGASGRVKGGTD